MKITKSHLKELIRQSVIDEIKEGGPPNLQSNWTELEGMALNKKKSDWYSNWITEIKTKVYIKRNPLTYPQITN